MKRGRFRGAMCCFGESEGYFGAIKGVQMVFSGKPRGGFFGEPQRDCAGDAVWACRCLNVVLGILNVGCKWRSRRACNFVYLKGVATEVTGDYQPPPPEDIHDASEYGTNGDRIPPDTTWHRSDKWYYIASTAHSLHMTTFPTLARQSVNTHLSVSFRYCLVSKLAARAFHLLPLPKFLEHSFKHSFNFRLHSWSLNPLLSKRQWEHRLNCCMQSRLQ